MKRSNAGAVIRVDKPAPLPPHGAMFVKSVGRDGSFTVTRLKDRARRFTLANAQATLARLINTQFQFSVCDAPI